MDLIAPYLQLSMFSCYSFFYPSWNHWHVCNTKVHGGNIHPRYPVWQNRHSVNEISETCVIKNAESFRSMFPSQNEKKSGEGKISGEMSRYISQLDIWRAAEMWNFSPRSERRSRCPFIFLTYMNTIDLSIIALKFEKKRLDLRPRFCQWNPLVTFSHNEPR